MYRPPPQDGDAWQQPPPPAYQRAQQLSPRPWVHPQHYPRQQDPNGNPNFLPGNASLQWQSPPPLLTTPAPPLAPPPQADSEQSQGPRPKANARVKPNLNESTVAVNEARRDILAAGKNVSAWKVTEAALERLNAHSWESLGFQPKQVPAVLEKIMTLEAKINRLIECFVQVRQVTSLYDLEVAICRMKGQTRFEELELGPLVKHPLVLHYFQVSPDTKEAFKITSEELIVHLHDFWQINSHGEVEADKFLDYVAEKRSVASKEKLTVRVHSLGGYVKIFRQVSKREAKIMKKLKKTVIQRMKKRLQLSSDHEDVRSCDNKRMRKMVPSQDDDLKEDNVVALALSKPSWNSNELIEAIRRDEFGLDSSHSPMLMKQHTRLERALRGLSQQLYSRDSHFLLELVQNADDNSYPESVEPCLTFILLDKGIVVLNNETGFSEENMRAICDVGSSTKGDMNARHIGKEGIGFKSVFRVTDAPEIHSNGFHVKFDLTEGPIGFVSPTVVPPCDLNFYSRLITSDGDRASHRSWKTCLYLPFKARWHNVESLLSDLHPSWLIFLHRLQCIRLRNMLDDTMLVMKKEVGSDGIVKVSVGKEKMAWLVVSKKLQAGPDAKETEISLAFTLQETVDGDYDPLYNQQPVFAFLPLRTYGLKFIVQADFVLPSSREEVDENSPRNRWILSEFPDLFVTAQESFSDLPSFKEDPGKAVTAFMNFVPLTGEVHGFFSSLPRMIIAKLRMSKCLLMEGDGERVQPCMVVRNWDERARALLPDSLLLEHLGIGLLRKDILLSDALAREMGIQDYGLKILVQVMESLSKSEDDLRNIGFGWLSAWMSEVYLMSLSGNESDLIMRLKQIPFIPLSNGKYCAVDSGTIWLHCGEHDLGAFSKLSEKLRTVNPGLLSEKSDHVERLLINVGVQRLTGHDIVKGHILPAICNDRESHADKDLMTEYLSFLTFHLQSNCPNCCAERDCIVDHLSQLLSRPDCTYLSEILITLWDDSDSWELGKPIVSSLISNLQTVKWMASTMDGELHCPKDLFYDCEQVRSLLGDNVPYVTLKVKSQKLLEMLGVKCVVTTDDILSILQVCQRCETPFRASISQMVHLYTFIWNETCISKDISSRALIFIPHESVSSAEEVVPGSILSAKQVFWSDTTGIVDQIKMLDSKSGLDMRMLQSLYPTLDDLFVKECGVEESPSVEAYLHLLMHLTKLAPPSHLATTVFKVFAKWADQLKCGSLSDEGVELLRVNLKERECAVLPSMQDKWVSLHPNSFGLVCWSDDDKLQDEFKNLEGVHILYSMTSLDQGRQYDVTSFAALMTRLGIPSLSSVVTREPTTYGGLSDSSFTASIVSWALPYAQRYMFHLHPRRYLRLKQSGFHCIEVVAVQKLSYKNAINGGLAETPNYHNLNYHN